MANNKEWEKEMMKWKKTDIINLLEKVITENKENPWELSNCTEPESSNMFVQYCPLCEEETTHRIIHACTKCDPY